MIDDLAKKLVYFSLIILALATYSSNKAYADDIFKGVSGPTNFQIDEKVFYLHNKKGTKTITNNLMLKYWDTKKLGVWAYISLPYKFVSSIKGSRNGISDVLLGFGPRGKIKMGDIGSIDYFSHLALTFPTGDSGSDIPLGNGRYDTRGGLIATYLTPDRKYEADISLEYIITGKNNRGQNSPNQKYAGFLVGGKIIDEMRIAAGITDLFDGKEHNNYFRIVLRLIFSKYSHIETIGDIGDDKRIGIQLRCNL